MRTGAGEKVMCDITESNFFSQGTTCAAWLYRPREIPEPPVVIMAHGFAAERTFRLPAFAERFVEKGMAAFLFDYRNFGASDGEPRNLVSPSRHLQDWKAAVAHVRALRGIDRHRIALWGSSFSGGHVIVIAAKDQGISAVVSQVPFVDGLTTANTLGVKYTLRALTAGFRDLARVLTFRAPYTVPVVGEPEAFAIMNTPGSKSGYLALVPAGSSWRNACPARVLLSVPLYRPISFADRVGCPVLFVVAERDSLIPAKVVERTALRVPDATVVRFPVGHFDVYVGETFEQVAEIEADFLSKHLVSIT